MPYIIQEKRDRLDPIIDQLHQELVSLECDDPSNNTEGNLNYFITRLLRKVYGTSYREINDAVGMLNCVILEHYRTIAAPYEDNKRYSNGDVEPGISSTILEDVIVTPPKE